MNVIVFNKMEHDVTQKPVPTFWHHALAIHQGIVVWLALCVRAVRLNRIVRLP